MPVIPNTREKLLRDIGQRAARMRRSKGWQQRAEIVYWGNRTFIHEHIRWRLLLGMEPGTMEDSALAYLIHQVHLSSLFFWKRKLRRIMWRCTDHPPGMYKTYLYIQIVSYEQPMYDDLLAGRGARHHRGKKMELSAEVMSRRLDTIKKLREHTLPKLMREDKPMSPVGPSKEFVPEWWSFARPEAAFYKAQNLEPDIPPLVDVAAAYSPEAATLLNEIHALSERHTFRTREGRSWLRQVEALGRRIGTTRRTDGAAPATLEAVNRLRSAVHSGTAVPNASVHDRILTLLDELCTSLGPASTAGAHPDDTP